ncbi:ABC transporter substrate-binding protein [Virgibacillus sp. DJP39]|uniref:ABC transporter substrate-binding protein n=1 Tax=Virgibacillus sp. DJP39 TaxID=3409790 RepID=UPI003BB69AEB
MTNRYFAMRAHFYEREHEKECQFKLAELEELWFCSSKNVKRILHQFQAEEKLSYVPGKGRGNRSKLIFVNALQFEVECFVKECLEHDKLDHAAQLLRLPIPKAWIAKVSSDIRNLFGYQKDKTTKDILHSLISREITTLDPIQTAITFESHLIEQLGDPLVKYDAEQDCILPHIAHHYQLDETQKVWTFHLRKGVLFHHQEQLTSRDVQATINRVKSGPASYAWLANEIVEVKCEGMYKVAIYLSQPNPFFLRYLASPNFCILPANLPFNEYEWIGTGPFSLKERSQDKLVLEAFDGYFKERPLLDEVHFYKVSSEAANLVNYTIDHDTLAEPVVKQEIETGFRFLAFNFNQSTIVQHPAFRQAIYHLLDMNKLAKALNFDQLFESSSFSVERSVYLEKDANLIKGLIKQSGYCGEELHLYHLGFDRARKEVGWFAEEAKKYGINFVLHTFDFTDFYNRTMDDHADLIFMGEVSSLDQHLSFFGAFYNRTLLFRRMFPTEDLGWIDQKLGETKTGNAKTREVVFSEIERHIRERNLIIFQYHPVKERTFHPMIKDAAFTSFGHFDFTKLWIPR